MSKRISTTLLFTVAIAVVALFAAAQVMAQVIDDPCTNFNLELVSVSANTDGSHTFLYHVTGGSLPLSKLSHVEFGVAASLDARDTNKVSDYPPMDGGIGNFNYAVGVPQVRVVSVVAQPGTGFRPVEFDIWGTGGKAGPVGIHTDAGNKQETCVAEGPIPFDSLDPVPQEFKYTREADGITCEMNVKLSPFFAIYAERINIPDPDPFPGAHCSVGEEKDIWQLGINSNADTAVEMQEGWFSFTGSPTEYCYYNKKKRKYICVTY